MNIQFLILDVYGCLFNARDLTLIILKYIRVRFVVSTSIDNYQNSSTSTTMIMCIFVKLRVEKSMRLRSWSLRWVSFCRTTYRPHCGRTSLWWCYWLQTEDVRFHKGIVTIEEDSYEQVRGHQQSKRSSDSVLVDEYKMVLSNDIIPIKDLPTTPLGARVPMDTVVKTSIQG